MLYLAAMIALTSSSEAQDLIGEAMQSIENTAWTEHLDATVYPESPYRSVDDLPPTIEIETTYQSFNDYYYFALVDGRIYYKPRFKRPVNAPEWDSGLAWKAFGLNNGLPYRLDVRKPMGVDTVYTDGDRQTFVREQTFESATEADLSALVKAPDFDWDAASSWSGEALAFDPEFPRPERIIAITADDDEIAVLDEHRQMFYRRRYANIFVSTEWYQGWGQAKELTVHFPAHITDHRGWSLGRITAFGAGYKVGPDGRNFEWGPAAVSMETLVWLSPDGRVVYYMDSGTPPEVEHFIEPPFRGQYRGEAINSSASTVMLIDRFGAIQTKLADFDMLGSTPTHPYCYFEECADQPYFPPGDIRSGMSDIRLPAEDWMVHMPVLPPEAWGEDTWLSKRISIHATGKGNAGRELRIVAMQAGELGYYHKGLMEDAWRFRPAPSGDQGFQLDPEDQLRPEELALYTAPSDLRALHIKEPVVDQELVGRLLTEDGAFLGIVVDDFNLQASPWHVRLIGDEIVLPMELHLVQAWNPYMSPHYGEDKEGQQIITYEGTLAFDLVDLGMRLADGPNAHSDATESARKLLQKIKNRKFALVVNANSDGFEVHPKRPRKTGEFNAIAVVPDRVPAEQDSMENWTAQFWSFQKNHMGWTERAASLEASRPASTTCGSNEAIWAAKVMLLDEQMDEDLKQIRSVSREARRFSRRTSGLSAFMYVSGLKWLDLVFDITRAQRSDTVRPNELRFNVITGVTTRIPYLATNISEVEAQRYLAAMAEVEAVTPVLEPLLQTSREIKRACH